MSWAQKMNTHLFLAGAHRAGPIDTMDDTMDMDWQARMVTYVAAAKARDLEPVVAFSDEHATWLRQELVRQGCRIVKERCAIDVLVSCKCWPFECDQEGAPPQKHGKEWDEDGYCCNGQDADDIDDAERCYMTFQWSGPWMEHHDNCYSDCCVFSKVFTHCTLHYVATPTVPPTDR
jgi:hypothetical protein